MSIKKYSSGQWVDTTYRKYESATDTITSLPADVIADGQSASANIIGNMQQTGTPSPQSIIMPSECGDKTENYFDKTAITAGYALSANGTITENANFGITGYIPVTGGADYKLYNLVTLQDYFTIRVHAYNGTTWIEQVYEQVINSRTASDSEPFTVPNNATHVRMSIGIVNRQNLDILMLSDNLNLTSYQPYGYKIPILSGGTTTNVYLREVQSTRQIVKKVFDGTENITSVSTSGGLAFLYLPVNQPNRWNTANNIVSSHFRPSYTNNDGSIYFSSNRMVLINLACTTVEDFKQWLSDQYTAGTPVTVWYVLATPETTTLNEPIRKIGTYADSVSVSNIPTTGTAEQFDVDTTLKPSEVDLTYHGWHEHSDTKFED